MLDKKPNNLKAQLEDKSYFLNEIAAITKTGSYSGNNITGEGFLDPIARNILEIPYDYEVTLENTLRFHVNKPKAISLFESCLNGDSFEEEIEMRKYDGTKFWAKASGKPYKNENGEIIGFRGVFTSIDLWVKNAIEAQKHAKIISAQNERLVHFAHIVSHNLRSHASNFQLTLETFSDLQDKGDNELFKKYLNDISLDLNKTLDHLNEVVIVHTQRKKQDVIDIEATVNIVLDKYADDLKTVNATVTYDFAELMSIEYVPSFFTSIIDHLMSNAIRFRSVNRPLVVNIKTRLKNGKRILHFKDNGSGIDLVKNGNKIFQMYRTFHDRDDSLGVGLFLIKNQVESLGGDIKIKSELDKGTKFSIRF